jgi:serine/threonine protein kinase
MSNRIPTCKSFHGTMTPSVLMNITQARDYIHSLPKTSQVPFSSLFPHASSQAIELLSQMLCFEPARRISCEQALSHAYLQDWRDLADEPVCEGVSYPPSIQYFKVNTLFGQTIDVQFDEDDSIEGVKKLIVEEVNRFRAEVRAQTGAEGQISAFLSDM